MYYIIMLIIFNTNIIVSVKQKKKEDRKKDIDSGANLVYNCLLLYALEGMKYSKEKKIVIY